MTEPQTSETVDHPAHYNAHPSGVECIDVVEHMGFNLGNAIKYIWRADEKGNAIDFKNTPGAWLWVLLPYHLAFDALYMALAIRRGFPRPIWRAYRAAWAGLPSIMETRRAERPRAPLSALLPAMAWTPWSPWLRELRPRAK